VLAVDVGGSHVKALLEGRPFAERRRFVSGPKLTPAEMTRQLLETTSDWRYDLVAIGVPAPVHGGRVVVDPVHLGPGWRGFDFESALGKPTRLINDAAMQALGSYDHGTMLFLGLGTGLGSALVVDGRVEPMELAHLPFRKATFEDYVGERGREQLGAKRWRRAVLETIELLAAALQPDEVVVGGGNAAKLDDLPENVRVGSNENAFEGGFRLWADPAGA
jgi:polyphosphate glucokinase